MKIKTSHVVVGGILLWLLLRKKATPITPVISPGPVVRPGTLPQTNVIPERNAEPAVSGTFAPVCYPDYHQVV